MKKSMLEIIGDTPIVSLRLDKESLTPVFAKNVEIPANTSVTVSYLSRLNP